jgi:hypothetical protein
VEFCYEQVLQNRHNEFHYNAKYKWSFRGAAGRLTGSSSRTEQSCNTDSNESCATNGNKGQLPTITHLASSDAGAQKEGS